MLETVTISVGGGSIPFESVKVRASVKEVARVLEFEFADVVGAPTWPGTFAGQPQASVTGGGDLVFTGYVDSRSPRLTAKDYRVNIRARGKGQDMVDCTVDHTRPDYVNQTVLAIAQDQDRFGIGFSADFSPQKIDRWRPNPGETLFHALEPLVEDEGATFFGQADGSVKITKAGASAGSQSGALIEGVNIMSASAHLDDSGQHSIITQHGQSYKGNGKQAIAISAQANNGQISRLRPLDHHHDRETSRDRLKSRAQDRRDREQGEGLRARVEVKGWRDSGGAIWSPGNLVFIKSPSLGLTSNMLIETVVYSQDGKRGTSCALGLVDARAFGGGGGGVNSSAADWGFDSSDAQ